MPTSPEFRFRGHFFVDGHVHFQPCFDKDRFLDGAVANFTRHAGKLGRDAEPAGWLLFTEMAGENYMRTFAASATDAPAAGWEFRRTEEDCTLIGVKDGRDRLVLVAGRQIVTAEKLEVLALGTNEQLADGSPLQVTIDQVRKSGAVAILPWGFGKWWFGRGRILGDWLLTDGGAGTFLGDNAGRPGFMPAPSQFDVGRTRNMFVLPGSDPLPFESEAGKAGSYGFVLRGEVRGDRPMAGLKACLEALDRQPATFGRLESAARFCRNQVLMQLAKQRRRPAA